MKINTTPEFYKDSAFLGGTCGNSTWRKDLSSMLNDNVPFFDPQVSEWTEANAANEDSCKQVARFNIFVITSDSLSTYSGWEIHEEACKSPEKLIFCTIGENQTNQFKGIGKIKRSLSSMGATVCESLNEIAYLLNKAYSKN